VNAIAAVWEKLSTIDASTQPYASGDERLLACVKAEGGHFEHLLK